MDTKRNRMLADGLAAGFVGYLAVVVMLAAWNLLVGRSPFFTAALLGEALFAGLRDPGLVVIEPGMVLAFNGVHLVAFLLFGYFGAWLTYETELHPEFWYLAFALFVLAVVVGLGWAAALSVMGGTLLAPAIVVAASVVGAGAVAGYLTLSHRSLVRAIQGFHGAEPEPGD